MPSRASSRTRTGGHTGSCPRRGPGRARSGPGPARAAPVALRGRRSASRRACAAGLHVDQAELGADLEVVAGLEVELGALADLADDDRVLLGHPFRRVGSGRLRQRRGNPVRSALTFSSSALADLDRLLQGLPTRAIHRSARRPRPAVWRRRSASRAVVALGLGAPRIGQQLAPAGVEGEQLVDLHGGAAARQSRLDPLGVGADQLQVEHGTLGQGESLARGAGFRVLPPAYLATNRRPLRPHSPTTMFCGMIAPEKPPFWIAKSASS